MGLFVREEEAVWWRRRIFWHDAENDVWQLG